MKDKHPAFNSWRQMRKRCLHKSHHNYDQYGGRGITICSRWLDSDNFLKDMLPTWFSGASIDRIDNDGPYSPENCRWATLTQQTINRRVTIWMDYQGERLHLAEVARRVGLDKRTLGWRLQNKWPVSALFIPIEAGKPLRTRNSVEGASRASISMSSP